MQQSSSDNFMILLFLFECSAARKQVKMCNINTFGFFHNSKPIVAQLAQLAKLS